MGPRRFSGDRLVVATHNPGKVAEIGALLEGRGILALSAGELGLPEPEETAATFRGNAALKARAAARAAGLPALADDSGLAVPALGGAPGIHSARWGGPEKDFAAAMRRVRDALPAGFPGGGPTANGPPAHFVCALALAWPDGHCETVEGFAHGTLVWPPRGEGGFGYDPMFVPLGDTRTYAELGRAGKHGVSHRSEAFRRLLARCFPPGPGVPAARRKAEP